MRTKLAIQPFEAKRAFKLAVLLALSRQLLENNPPCQMMLEIRHTLLQLDLATDSIKLAKGARNMMATKARDYSCQCLRVDPK